MKQEPKFKITDKVKHPKDLYKDTQGEIYGIEKMYQECYSHDDMTFDPEGLTQLGSHIHNIQIPYTFEDDVLRVTFPEADYGSFIMKERTNVYRFSGYAYSVKSPQMNSLFSESSLRLIK